ncbi:MAG: GH92 family glycosyl hydrolase [Alistipes sp.]|nr:GH92 family glycosyl hydrolase [Alistipes sp.]
MKKKTLLYVSLMILTATSLFAQQAKRPVDYVNPMIGTDGMGHTFPGACAPFGIVQLSPDTDTIPHNINGKYQKEVYEYCAGYQYHDTTIVGFSHTHFSGTGHSDLGDILIMPTTGELKLNPGTKENPDSGYRSRFSHETEKSAPGYYEVMLDDYNVRAQLTATQRVGIHKYTFPKGGDKSGDGRIILDLNHGIYNYDGKTLWASIRVESPTLITGYRITNGWARTNYTYFAISFSQPIKNYGYKDFEKILYNGFWRKFKVNSNFPEMAGRKVVSYFEFDTESNAEVVVKVALSATSTDGAVKNLMAESATKDFDAIASETSNAWNEQLSSIEVEGSEDQKAMLYTSYYHTMINPSVYMDVDGKYRGLDQNTHQADGFKNYTIFSLWDTYRAEHPFLMLMKPTEARDMAMSMIRHQQQSVHGLLPIWSHMANDNWCMSGYHATSVLADAITKGANIDKQEALKAMVTTSNVAYFDGIGDYVELGYVPLETTSTAASTTLEYCYDDWTIYNTALAAGDKEVADEYYKRALNYRNIYDKELGFAHPKYRDGSFKETFDVLQTHGEGFIEGNSWNFSFHVPHDVFGVINQMGGEQEFLRKLDELFAMHLPEEFYAANEDITSDCLIGGYVHGNEPSHHIPYLYAWTSQPWKTQYWVREVMNKMYKNHIRGLGGNDDCGQMSAWYLFSAMGFYPVCPGTDQYVLGAPYVPYMKLTLDNGKIFEIKAPEVSDTNRYVKAVLLNGKPYTKTYITHSDLLGGGTLEFVMSAKPNKKRGLALSDKPYSLTNGE